VPRVTREAVERLAEDIAVERWRGARALFLRRGARPPFLLWRPRESDLPVPPLVSLLRWWMALPRASGAPPVQDIDPATLVAVGDHVLLLEPVEDGRDLVYRRYAPALVRTFGRDLTGQHVSAIGGHSGLFIAASYRAVLRRGEPLCTAHEPESDLVTQSDRIVLPLAGPDGTVARLVVGCVPEAPFRALIDTVMDGMLVLDRHGAIRMANAPATTLLGCSEERLLGRELREVLRADFLTAWLDGGEGIVTAAREAVACRADGTTCPVEVSIGRTRRAHRPLFVAVLRDVSARKAAEARYRALALTDPLTGLANRVLFQDRLGQALARARRAREGLALMMIDLDGFKAVNDRFGHPGGDRVLRDFAGRIRAAVREADVLARLGGDEFALIQTDLEQPEGALTLAERLLAALAEPFLLDGQSLALGASLGIAVYPRHGESIGLLTEHADQALYRAKRRGGRCFVLYDALKA
jgi:diguanylate cyclase (GGDEF)-like protein/PAS domain S-box-containing protein